MYKDNHFVLFFAVNLILYRTVLYFVPCKVNPLQNFYVLNEKCFTLHHARTMLLPMSCKPQRYMVNFIDLQRALTFKNYTLPETF